MAKIVFSIIKQLTLSRLKLLEKYVTDVEGLIQENVNEYLKQAEEETKGYSNEQKEQYYDFHLEQHHQLKYGYSSVLRYSIITTTHSTLEQMLMRLHNQKSKDKKGYRKYKDNNSDIGAVIEYIRNEMEIKIPNSDELDFISDLTKIRNNIVHSNGRVYDDTNPDRLRCIIKNYSFIEERSGELVIHSDFIVMMLVNVTEFLNSVFKVIDNEKNFR
jgi:hypothetical protein